MIVAGMAQSAWKSNSTATCAGRASCYQESASSSFSRCASILESGYKVWNELCFFFLLRQAAKVLE